MHATGDELIVSYGANIHVESVLHLFNSRCRRKCRIFRVIRIFSVFFFLWCEIVQCNIVESFCCRLAQTLISSNWNTSEFFLVFRVVCTKYRLHSSAISPLWLSLSLYHIRSPAKLNCVARLSVQFDSCRLARIAYTLNTQHTHKHEFPMVRAKAKRHQALKLKWKIHTSQCCSLVNLCFTLGNLLYFRLHSLYSITFDRTQCELLVYITPTKINHFRIIAFFSISFCLTRQRPTFLYKLSLSYSMLNYSPVHYRPK